MELDKQLVLTCITTEHGLARFRRGFECLSHAGVIHLTNYLNLNATVKNVVMFHPALTRAMANCRAAA